MVEESGNIRLVRCPKCANVLHEPANYSVYLCGGCDTALRAKKPSLNDDSKKIERTVEVNRRKDKAPMEDYVKKKVLIGREDEFNSNSSSMLRSRVVSGRRVFDEKPYGEGTSNHEHNRIDFLEQHQNQIRMQLNDLMHKISRLSVNSHEMKPVRGVNSVNSMYNGSFRSRITRPAYEPPQEDYYSIKSRNSSQNLHLQESFNHEKGCSCLDCYTRTKRIGRYSTRSNPYYTFSQASISSTVSQVSQVRWRNDADSDADVFKQKEVKRVVDVKKDKEVLVPIAGGAPFMTCLKCFELLKLPAKVIRLAKDQKKLRCGSCSSVYSFEFIDNRLVISVPVDTNQMDVNRVSHEQTLDSNSNSNQHGNAQDHMSDKCVSEQESSPRSEEKTAEIITNAVPEPKPEAEPEPEHDNENAVEVSFSEYIDTSVSQSSVPEITEEEQPARISVNGHTIPPHLAEKAELRAGKIHPGDYWYDYRAGFWGVLGQPCCGIIAPNIDEFNYSMPENCAAGNTNVFVNGRELHQTDLDLLVSRGLPNRLNKNYIIEISGKVVDEDSGLELKSLGKLAPTVEKVKRGFGMKVPRRTQL